MPLCWWLYKVTNSSSSQMLGICMKGVFEMSYLSVNAAFDTKFSVWENEHNSTSVSEHRKIMSLLYMTVRWTNDDLQQTGYSLEISENKKPASGDTDSTLKLSAPRSMALAWPSIHLLSGWHLSPLSNTTHSTKNRSELQNCCPKWWVP